MCRGGGYRYFVLPPACLLPAPSANQRTSTMNHYDLTDEDILTFEVSDEALETAAGTGKEKAGNYTLGFCTGLSACPAS